ncbi:hypothetical protein [Algisphaera agarilytica]|uniref:Uncharacterized protein n=1 Tax=Algisphaera agarilytica TaxID=1385975 RepID=A0A7X0H5Z8_9BACT|nr:hypothetical protein [Algisphaera agarilytica]MBB6428424.1 hypothetical protein [Algisphaera agarilytica]
MRWARRIWEDFNGLVTPADLMGVVGLWLYKGTARRTMAVALTFAGLLVLRKKVDTGVSLGSAVSGTGLILLVSFLGGIALMVLSGSVARRDLKLAEAKGSNLLENMKKSRASIHADVLWDHVFKYEQDLAGPEDIAAEKQALALHRDAIEEMMADVFRCGTHPPRVFQGLGLTEEGFHLAFDFGVRAPLSRSVLRRQLRYDFSKVSHWYDGAPFHHTDTKLEEQFQAGDELGDAQRMAGMNWFDSLRQTRLRSTQMMWMRFISRAIQIRVAQACRSLDEDYPGFDFLPDHFLWPNAMAEQTVKSTLGEEALVALIDTRRRVFQRVFNREPELAKNLMKKAVYPNFELATELRRRFDPEYVVGALDQSWQDGLCRFGRAIPAESRRMRKVQAFIESTRRGLEELDQRPEGEAVRGLTPLEQRAVRIAHHCGQDAAISAVLPKARRINRLLLAVRVHHTLAQLEMMDYEFYLDEILN